MYTISSTRTSSSYIFYIEYFTQSHTALVRSIHKMQLLIRQKLGRKTNHVNELNLTWTTLVLCVFHTTPVTRLHCSNQCICKIRILYYICDTIRYVLPANRVLLFLFSDMRSARMRSTENFCWIEGSRWLGSDCRIFDARRMWIRLAYKHIFEPPPERKRYHANTHIHT